MSVTIEDIEDNVSVLSGDINFKPGDINLKPGDINLKPGDIKLKLGKPDGWTHHVTLAKAEPAAKVDKKDNSAENADEECEIEELTFRPKQATTYTKKVIKTPRLDADNTGTVSKVIHEDSSAQNDGQAFEIEEVVFRKDKLPQYYKKIVLPARVNVDKVTKEESTENAYQTFLLEDETFRPKVRPRKVKFECETAVKVKVPMTLKSRTSNAVSRVARALGLKKKKSEPVWDEESFDNHLFQYKKRHLPANPKVPVPKLHLKPTLKERLLSTLGRVFPCVSFKTQFYFSDI